MKLKKRLTAVLLSMVVMMSGLATTELSTQAATSSVTASNVSSGIKLKWTKNTTAKGYYIYRNSKKIKTISSNSTVTFTDTGSLTNGSKYTYKVVPYTSSKTLTSSTKSTYRLKTPTINTISSPSAGKLKITYSGNAKANGYQIRYSKSSDFSTYSKVTVKSSSTLSKTISNLSQGKRYYVKVRSYKTVNGTNYYSGWSSKKYVTVKKSTSTSTTPAPSGKIYITRTGTKYHSRACGSGTYYETTLEDAKRRGLEPCSKCF